MGNSVGLITDFGLSDPYVGVMKAVLFSKNPQANVIDITHDIPPHNIGTAAEVLRNSYPYFPKATVFLVVVDPGVGTHRQILAVKTPGYFFVGPDNGVLSKVISTQSSAEVRVVRNPRFFLRHPPSSTFHGRDIMAPVAALLSTSNARRVFEQLGPRTKTMKRLPNQKSIKKEHEIAGEIIMLDRFGNAMTNIAESYLSPVQWKQSTIYVDKHKIGRLRKTYGDSKRAPLGIINSFNQLEIAVPHGSAQSVLGLRLGQRVRIVYG